MYGIFNVNLGLGDTASEHVACNHLTRAGLQHVLKGKPERIQSVIVPAADNKIFTNVLNYMFIVLGTKDDPSPISDEDIYGLTFDNLPENIIWVDRGSEASTANYPLGELETIYIKGIGIGHKDLGGDPANNFIFSYANMPVTITNVRYDGESNGALYWTFKADYNFYTKSPSIPAVKFKIGERTYNFKESPVYESINGYTSNFTTALGFSNWTGPNATSLTSAKPAFCWSVCGKAGVQAEVFDEQIVEDPNTRELTRVFKVVYNNVRPFDIDITGFFYIWGTQYFNYRSDVGDYIRVPAGKKLELTFAIDAAGGAIPPVDNKYFSYTTPPITQGYDAFSLKDHTYFAKVHYVQYEGTSKEKKRSFTDTYSSSSNWFNDELTKVYYEYTDGTFSAPNHVLGSKTPPSFAFAAPSIATSDGWVLQNNKLVFGLTAPTGVSKVQFGNRKNQWTTFNVTGGTINYLDLPVSFLYEAEMFIRWSNGTSTGLITYYVGNITNTPEMVCYEPVTINGVNMGYHIVGLPSRQAVPFPWQTTTDQNLNTWYDNIKAVNTNETYTPITLGNFSSATAARLPTERKWFNPITKTLDAVPNFVMVRSGTPTSTPNGTFNWFPDSGKRNPTQTTAIVPVAFNGTPRVNELTRVKKPTALAPNKIKLTTLTGTRKVEIYNTDNNSIVKSVDTKPGTDYTINIETPLYDHIFYGIRYLNENNVNQSLGLEYLFKGIELAAPDEIRDIHYDIDAKTLTFVTPARAKRATITRWGFELFSFETTVGGETVLFTSEPFDPSGNYILTLFNDEGVANTPYYIFGQQPDDQPVKPVTTGPYLFSDWVYNSGNYTTNTDLPFMKIEQFEAGLYNVKIDGNLARVVEVKRNAANILMSVIFEAKGVMLQWSTGYIESNETIGSASSTSSINIVLGGNGYSIVEVWHEWDLYSKLGIENFGTYAYGKYTPKFGKNTSWYQFTEVQTGYVRNSLKLLMRRNGYGGKIPWEYDSTLTAKTPFAQIYFHTNDIVGSPNYNSNANQQYYKYTMFKPIINGVTGEWDPTFGPDGFTITKIRAVTPDVVLVLDTANKAKGWVLEGFDELLVGDPDYKDIAYTFELYCDQKWFYNTYVGSYPNSSGIDTGANSAVRYLSTYYVDDIFTRFYPYMELMTFEQATGIKIEKANYDFSGSHNWNESARWVEAYITGSISGMMENTSVIINGKLATITTKEVTLPYTPSPFGIVSQTQFEKPPVNANLPTNYATQEPFTFTAYVFTTDDLVISNERHPKVLSIVTDNRSNKANTVNMVFVRNRILQPAYDVSYYGNTENVRVNNSIYQYGNYYYNYTTVVFYPTYPKIMKDGSDPGKWEFDAAFTYTRALSSLYGIGNVIRRGIGGNSIEIPEGKKYHGLFQINGQNVALVLEDAWVDWLNLEEKTSPYIGYIAKLTDELNPQEIRFNQYTGVEYVGFEPGTDIVVTANNNSGYGSLELLNALLAQYSEMSASPMAAFNNFNLPANLFGYNKSTFLNYLPHVVPTGYQGLNIQYKAKTLVPTVRDENYVLIDRTEDIMGRYNTNFNAEYNITLDSEFFIKHLDMENPNFDVIGDLIKVYCNDVQADMFSVDPETTNITWQWTNLSIKVIFQAGAGNLVLWDTELDVELNSDTLNIFKFVTTGLSLYDTGSAFTVVNPDSNQHDNPLYDVYWPNIAFYNDVNGDERIQSMYIITGNKPRNELPIDSRIGASPYPSTFSEQSFTYTNLPQVEIPS